MDVVKDIKSWHSQTDKDNLTDERRSRNATCKEREQKGNGFSIN